MNKFFYFSFFVFVIVASLSVDQVKGSEDDDRQLEIATFITEHCRNGDIDGKILTSIENARLCGRTGVQQLFDNLGDVLFQSTDTAAKLFNKNCVNLKNQTLSCIDTNVATFAECLTDDEKTKTNIYKNIIVHALDYGCSNNGYKLAPLVTDEAIACFIDKTNEINGCYHHILLKYEQQILPSQLIHDGNCNDLKSVEICIIPVTKSCQGEIVSNFFSEFLKILTDALSCPINESDVDNEI